MSGDLLLGIPSGFARRGAGRLGGRHTSPATRSLLFGNLLDFVSAGGGKNGKIGNMLEGKNIQRSLGHRIDIISILDYTFIYIFVSIVRKMRRRFYFVIKPKPILYTYKMYDICTINKYRYPLNNYYLCP